MMEEGNRTAEDGKGGEELEGEADKCRQRGNEYFGRRVRWVETGCHVSTLFVLLVLEYDVQVVKVVVGRRDHSPGSPVASMGHLH